jgi:dolichyl-phosphate-mannose-protein mannosyltransferase
MKPKILLGIILLFSLLTRVWRLDFPKGYYFDEVYNAFTTREFVKNNKDAYEWFHSPSGGTAYGWTHPPLAKLIAATGIKIFGDNEFGWRIANALIGVGIIYLVYWIGRQLLRSESGGLTAAFLASLDGLLLVQSRINMNDIVATFFILVVFAAFLKKNLYWLGVSLGLLLATKWTGLYAIAFFGIILGLQNGPRSWPKLFLALIVVPLTIYILSYTQYFLLGGSWANFLELQNQMWQYNVHLTATHTYQSPWWSWPLDLRPVWYFVDYSKPDFIANIYALGNPLLFWLGIPAVIYTAAKAKGLTRLLILLGCFGFWLPWARAPRIMFIYHYLPSVPFLCLALAFTLSDLNKKWLTVGSLTLIAAAFIFFFPHWTAISVPVSLANFYYWLPGWK